jgi:O-antigen/teichoic acid export membrane protein
VNHKRGDDLVFLRTAWTVQIVRSFIITALGMLLSYPFALLFADETHPPDMLFWVTLATTGAMLINGFQSVSFFLGTRELRVARTLLMDLIAQTIGTGVSILLAWQLRNVWALVIGNLLTTLLRTILSFVMLQKVPLRLCWDAEARKDLLGFGKWILVSTVLTFFANAMDRFLLAKLLGLAAFGLYNTALMFAMVPIELMLRITVGVLVPVYAKKKDADNRLSGEVFDRVGFVMLLVSGCLIAGVAATAPGFVRAVYKPAFHEAAAMVPWLAGAAWLRALHNNAVAAMLAMGRAKSSALGNALKLAGVVVLVPAGFFLMREESSIMPGVIGACAGLALAEALKYVAFTVDASRAGLRPLRADVPGSIQFATAMAVVLGLQWWLRSRGTGPAAEALICGAAVVAVYLPALYRGGRMVAPHMKLPGFVQRLLRV